MKENSPDLAGAPALREKMLELRATALTLLARRLDWEADLTRTRELAEHHSDAEVLHRIRRRNAWRAPLRWLSRVRERVFGE